MKKIPYERIEKGDRILIYGAGEIGQSLFWQFRNETYCALAGITDRSFPANSLPPFYTPENASKIAFDKVLIASALPDVIASIRAVLRSWNVGEERIISCNNFDITDVTRIFYPAEFPFRSAYYLKLDETCRQSGSVFAGESVYQSFPELGISGRRGSEERLAAYRMENYLNRNSTVLDIGCNCGFLDLQIAAFAGRVTGVDVDPHLIRMAELTRDYLGIQNAAFQCRNLFVDTWEEKFDAVCLFAVHMPVMQSLQISAEEFANRTLAYIQPDGFLFFESHRYLNREQDKAYFDLDAIFREKGMKLYSYLHHYGKQEGNIYRDISVYRREGLA